MKKIIIILLLLSFMGCKSSKQLSNLKSSNQMEIFEESEPILNEATMMTSMEIPEKIITIVDTVEEQTHTFENFDSSGVNILKPVVKIVKKTTTTTKTDQISVDATKKEPTKSNQLIEPDEIKVVENYLVKFFGEKLTEIIMFVLILLSTLLGIWIKYKKIKSGE